MLTHAAGWAACQTLDYPVSANRLPICFGAALLLHGLATLVLKAQELRPERASHLPVSPAPVEPPQASVLPAERVIAVESPVPGRAAGDAEMPMAPKENGVMTAVTGRTPPLVPVQPRLAPPPVEPKRGRSHRGPATGRPLPEATASSPERVPPPAASTAIAAPATSGAPPRTTDSSAGEPSPETPPIDLKSAMLSATKHNEVPSSVMASFGSMEMLLKERWLERALTWVFPKVVSYDKSYWRWPTGDLGTIDFTVTLGESGRILGADFGEVDADAAGPRSQGPSGHARLKGLVEQMIRFLAPGRFSRGTGNEAAPGGPVERRFSLTVRHRVQVSDGEAEGTEQEGELVRIGFDAPAPGRPGRGYVGATNGHEFEATLTERQLR